MRTSRRRSAQRGSAIIEFALIAFLLMIVIFAVIEFDRLALVYTTMANSAKAGMRYAIVHGSHRSGGSGADGASGALDSTQVVNVVKYFASAGILDTSRLSVSVQYPSSASPTDPGNGIGSGVLITVSYPYDPFVTVLPLRVNLVSTSRGIIAY
jgi:Flp pilus assembly protein TadG